MYTYRDLIRKYAQDVANGHADVDLTPKERRLVQVMLNLASNSPAATAPYPPAPNERDAAVRHLSDILWESRALIEAVSTVDVSAASERAITILRAM